MLELPGIKHFFFLVAIVAIFIGSVYGGDNTGPTGKPKMAENHPKDDVPHDEAKAEHKKAFVLKKDPGDIWLLFS